MPHPYLHTSTEKFGTARKLFYLGGSYFFITTLVVTGWALVTSHQVPKETFGDPGIGSWFVVRTCTGFALGAFVVSRASRFLRIALAQFAHKSLSKLI